MSKLGPRVLIIFLATATAALAALQPGSLDPSFDPGSGLTNNAPAGTSTLLIQPDDRIIVSAAFNVFNGAPLPSAIQGLARLQANGLLDPTFQVRSLDEANRLIQVVAEGTDSLAVDRSGRVTGCGSLIMADGVDHRLFRLQADGAIDGTFLPLVGGESPLVHKVLLQPDGKLVVLGQFDTINGVAAPHLARLGADGKLDQTFKPPYLDRALCMGRQSDGRLVVGTQGNSLLLVRLNADGSKDETFTPPPPPYREFEFISSLKVLADDKILLVNSDRTVRRLMADGKVDPAFHATTYEDVEIQAVQHDGKILITPRGAKAATAPRRLNPDGTVDLSLQRESLGALIGQQSNGKLISARGFQKAPFMVRRLSLTGVLDTSFGGGEGATVQSPGAVVNGFLLPDGKVLVQGYFDRAGAVPRQGLARFHRNGTVDTSFDAGTQIKTGEIRAIAADRTGTIFVSYYDPTVAGEVIARLSDTGKIEASFPIPYHSFGVRLLAFPNDGAILVGGEAGLAEFNRDGSWGTAFNPSFFYETGHDHAVYKIAIQTDGKIIANMGRLRRFWPTGPLDSAYTDNAAWFQQFPTDFALQPGDKLVVAPQFGTEDPPPPLIRINQDGTVDDTFQPAASAVSPLAIDSSAIYGMSFVSLTIPPFGNAIYRYKMERLLFSGARDPDFVPPDIIGGAAKILPQPDGQIVIVGDFTEVNGVARNGIARLIGNAPRKLANISTRAQVEPGDGAEIGGFIVTGTAPKKVVIRGLGPSMQAAGLAASATLADPQLEVRDGSGALIARNYNWQDSQQAEIVASGLAPADPLEAALVMTLQPGSYTAIVRGGTSESGLALVEIYDLDASADSTLANISTRGVVGAGDAVLIGGFILHGFDASTVVLRALGPSLSSSGVTGWLPDPVLELRNQNGELTSSNDDWQSAQKNEIEAAGLAPSNSAEAAIAASLPPGSYTAAVHGRGSTVGIALFEAYRLP